MFSKTQPKLTFQDENDIKLVDITQTFPLSPYREQAQFEIVSVGKIIQPTSKSDVTGKIVVVFFTSSASRANLVILLAHSLSWRRRY